MWPFKRVNKPKEYWRAHTYVQDDNTIKVYVSGWDGGDYPMNHPEAPLYIVRTESELQQRYRECQDWCAKTNFERHLVKEIVRKNTEE